MAISRRSRPVAIFWGISKMKKVRNTLTTRILRSLVVSHVLAGVNFEAEDIQLRTLAAEHGIKWPTREEVEGM
jgi:hypothetical protein